MVVLTTTETTVGFCKFGHRNRKHIPKSKMILVEAVHPTINILNTKKCE